MVGFNTYTAFISASIRLRLIVSLRKPYYLLSYIRLIPPHNYLIITF